MKNYRNIYIILLLISAHFIFSSFSPVNEKLRLKIENISITKQLSNTYNVYCIPSLREAYLINEFEAFWYNESQIQQFIDILSSSSKEGLNPEDYHYSELISLRRSETNKLNFEILMSDAFLLYSSHLINGKLNPKNIDPEWHVIKDEINPTPMLFKIKSNSVNQIIENILPKNKNYTLLKNELSVLRQKEATGRIEQIEKGDLIKMGMNDSRIPAIRKRLIQLQYIEDNAELDIYDEDLFNAIALFQIDYGLEAKGIIGNQTIGALNLTNEEKIEVIVANMERMRWLPISMPSYYIYVNIANFNLDIIKNDTTIRSHKVIVGKTARQTPVFFSTMGYIVFNPTWTVPPTILKNDMIPEVRKRVEYLNEKHISVYNSSGDKLDPKSIDWKSNAVMGYTYRQEAGVSNALGAVKFMFPNSFNIYLHDTPSRDLFEKTERAFSSGCIRVHNPLIMAEFLLSDSEKYSLKEINEIVKSGKTTSVILREKPEVFLLYQTAWANNAGKVVYRIDIYKRDNALKNSLSSKPVYDVVVN